MAALRRGSFYHAGDQWMLHFEEKGGKSREIPVRHDLEQMIFEYLDAAGLRNAPKEPPVPDRLPQDRAAHEKRHVRRGRLPDGQAAPQGRGLPSRLSPHSFRVTTITDLLEQGVPLEDVQRLAGHADPRTTRLYDRRQKGSRAISSRGYRFEPLPQIHESAGSAIAELGRIWHYQCQCSPECSPSSPPHRGALAVPVRPPPNR